VTKLAGRLLALTAARPGVVRLAEPDEFEDLDGDRPLWRIPAEKMKLTREQQLDLTYEFVIPLSRQAVEVVRTALALAGPKTRLLFPSVKDVHRPISDSTLSKFYRDAGLTGVHVPHGWRSTFSTLMNKSAAEEGRKDDREIIDLMLAHMSAGVEPIYNRYLYMPRRRAIAQEWADELLHGAPSPAALVDAQRGSSPRAARARARDRRLALPPADGRATAAAARLRHS
jgi:integrase